MYFLQMESLAIADETASEETIPQKIQDQNETEKSIIEPSTTLSKKKQKKLMKQEQWLKQKAEMRWDFSQLQTHLGLKNFLMQYQKYLDLQVITAFLLWSWIVGLLN